MTFSLGAKSLKELQGVHPKLIETVKLAIVMSPVDFSVHDGLRTQAEQQALFNSGASKTMNSKHKKQEDGYGHAVDLVPVVNNKLRWEWPLIYPIAAAMSIASQRVGIELVWGGVWDKKLHDFASRFSNSDLPPIIKKEVDAYCLRHPGPDFIDGPHYQIA